MNSTTRQRLGSSILRGTLKILGAGVVALLAVGLILLLHVRSDYYAKVSINQAVSYAEQVMLAIDGHRALHRNFPASLSDLSLPVGDPGYVPKLALDASAGALLVDVETSHGKFGSLRYVPSRDSSTTGRWRCVNVSVPVKLLPAQCSQVVEN